MIDSRVWAVSKHIAAYTSWFIHERWRYEACVAEATQSFVLGIWLIKTSLKLASVLVQPISLLKTNDCVASALPASPRLNRSLQSKINVK